MDCRRHANRLVNAVTSYRLHAVRCYHSAMALLSVRLSHVSSVKISVFCNPYGDEYAIINCMIKLKKSNLFFTIGLVLVLISVVSIASIIYYEKDKPWLHATGIRLCNDRSSVTCDYSETSYNSRPGDSEPYSPIKRIAPIVFLAGTVMLIGSTTIDVYKTIKSRRSKKRDS